MIEEKIRANSLLINVDGFLALLICAASRIPMAEFVGYPIGNSDPTNSVRISQGQLLSIAVNYMSQLLYINASHPLVFERFNVPIFMRYNVSSNRL